MFSLLFDCFFFFIEDEDDMYAADSTDVTPTEQEETSNTTPSTSKFSKNLLKSLNKISAEKTNSVRKIFSSIFINYILISLRITI